MNRLVLTACVVVIESEPSGLKVVLAAMVAVGGTQNVSVLAESGYFRAFVPSGTVSAIP